MTFCGIILSSKRLEQENNNASLRTTGKAYFV